MEEITAFYIGCVVGVVVGYFIAMLLVTASRDEDYYE